MRKIDLGQTISILANVGVIASILFLGIQLRESGRQARVTTNQELVSQMREWELEVAGDDILGDVYFRGLEDFQSLSPLEQSRFDLLMRSRLRVLNSALLAQELGVIGTNPEGALPGQVVQLWERPGFRQWWAVADLRGLPSSIRSFIEDTNDQSPLRGRAN